MIPQINVGGLTMPTTISKMPSNLALLSKSPRVNQSAFDHKTSSKMQSTIIGTVKMNPKQVAIHIEPTTILAMAETSKGILIPPRDSAGSCSSPSKAGRAGGGGFLAALCPTVFDGPVE